MALRPSYIFSNSFFFGWSFSISPFLVISIILVYIRWKNRVNLDLSSSVLVPDIEAEDAGEAH
jgi:hypothetical protein